MEIENIYLDGDKVAETVTVEVPSPPNLDFDSLEHEDWAYENLFPHTGTGRTDGDAGYFVTILSASYEPRLAGQTYEWGT